MKDVGLIRIISVGVRYDGDIDVDFEDENERKRSTLKFNEAKFLLVELQHAVARQTERDSQKPTAGRIRLNERVVTVVRHKGQEFRLSQELLVRQTDSTDGATCEIPDLGIIAVGKDGVEANEAMNSEFVTIWNTLANTADDKLTQDAINLRNKMRSLVWSVRNIDD